MSNEAQNQIQTALEAAQKPFLLQDATGENFLLTPDGLGEWRVHDLQRDTPQRKNGNTYLHDAESLIKFINKHKQDGTEIYINADFECGNITVKAVINGDTAQESGFKDFKAIFTPKHTPNANAWLKNNKQRMNQMDFAAFLTNQARDIVAQNPDNPNAKLPTGAEVLDFALNLEYTEKTTFKQGYREQDGRINFTFQSEDAGKNDVNLKMFEKFGIAFTPYLNGDSFFVEAALKFRIDKNNGNLVLWYELQQVHKVMEMATQAIAEKLQQEFSDLPIYYGEI